MNRGIFDIYGVNLVSNLTSNFNINLYCTTFINIVASKNILVKFSNIFNLTIASIEPKLNGFYSFIKFTTFLIPPNDILSQKNSETIS